MAQAAAQQSGIPSSGQRMHLWRRLVIDQSIDGFVSSPRDAAQQHLLNLVVGEIGVLVSLHPYECACGLSAGRRMFKGPDLGHYLTFVLTRACSRGMTVVAST